MTFDGSVGLKDGLAFIYRNMMGRDGVTEKMLEDFLPVMADASVALQKIFETGFAKAHLSKDGTPEHVFFPRQAYLKEGNPNDEASLRRLEEMGEAWRNNVDAAVFIGIGGSYSLYKSGEIIPRISACVEKPAEVFKSPLTCPKCGTRFRKRS